MLISMSNVVIYLAKGPMRGLAGHSQAHTGSSRPDTRLRGSYRIQLENVGSTSTGVGPTSIGNILKMSLYLTKQYFTDNNVIFSKER